MRYGARVELQRQVRHARAAGADRVGAVRGDSNRGDVVGEDEVEDRQVVRREVPHHVDVALDQAQVDAYRVDVVQLTQLAGVDQLADAGDRRGVAVRVVTHEHQAARAGL